MTGPELASHVARDLAAKGPGGYATARVVPQGDLWVVWFDGLPRAEVATRAEAYRFVAAVSLALGASK
jgi:hypothetical protein